MNPTIAALVLFSAALHPLWNAVVKRQKRTDTAYIGLVTVLMVLSLAHSALLRFDLLAAVTVWPFIAVSVVGQLLYGSSLMITLRQGDLSSYYPIVRSSPVFVVIVSVLFLGESYSWLLIIGIACVLGGAFVLQYRGRSHLLDDPRTLLFALLAMSGTGIYSLVDARAVQSIEPPVLFFWVEFFSLPSYLLIFRYFGVPETRFSQLFQWTARPYLFFGIGLICYLSYFLILTAYSMGGEVAAVTAVRQASIPISVLLGGLMFREGSIVRRFGASCLLVLGILIIVTG